MEDGAQRALFTRLSGCTSSGQLRSVLSELGDSDSSTLDIPFGKHRLMWRAYGNTASNNSTIGLGTKPGRSLAERITNAIDAVLDDRVVEGISPPTSPRQAANQWFGRPISGVDSGLFFWKSMPQGFDRHIHVILHQSDKEGSPTVDVLDDGIGIEGKHFPATILSLLGGNKIKKRHLIGAFGQGGAATLGFCDYAIIFSKARGNPEKIAFTIVRVLKLDASFKEDCYAYLGLETEDKDGSKVFQVDFGPGLFNPYSSQPAGKVPGILQGTLVRHVNYRLTNLDKGLQASPGNLYHYLHYSVFDPLIPFRIADLRAAQPKNEYVGGARNRLMGRVKEAQQSGIDDDEKNVQIKHYRPMEFVVPSGSVDASVGIEYWVVFGFRKKGSDTELRGHSNELFVQHGYPIVGTLNGQNQGEYTAQILKQLGLSLLSRHIVIHIDATNADSTVRRELFSTSREGFKDGPVLESLLLLLRKILEEDERLFEIEKELTERITQKEAESTKSEVKREVARLLRDAGFAVKEEGKVDVPGKGEKQKIEPKPGPGPRILDPLPTLPYPQVTRFEIVYPKDLFQLPLNDTQAIVVETDADAAFDKFVSIRSEPPILVLATRAPLRGGRIRWRLRPGPNAQARQEGEVIATITKPDGSQMSSKVLFELLPAQEKEAKKAAGYVPPFEIKPISPADGERWNALWSDDHDDPELQAKHAYKVLHGGGTVTVFYSTVFAPYKEAGERLKVASAARLPIFETNYQIWVGYHAILQSQQPIQESSGASDEMLEQIQEVERQTVARVQVRQALRISELLEQKAIQAEAKG